MIVHCAHAGFPHPNGKKVQYRAHSDAPPKDQPDVTPALLRKMYNISMPVASQGVNNTQAVFETTGECCRSRVPTRQSH
jgi:hypothetical protein